MTNSFSLSLLLTLGDEISALFAYAHNHTLAQRQEPYQQLKSQITPLQRQSFPLDVLEKTEKINDCFTVFRWTETLKQR